MGEPESLEQDADLVARDRRHAYDRLIMLSDGVFAIAITLLARESARFGPARRYPGPP